MSSIRLLKLSTRSQVCVKYYDGAGTQLHSIVEFPHMVLITPNLEDFLLDCPSIAAGALDGRQALYVVCPVAACWGLVDLFFPALGGGHRLVFSVFHLSTSRWDFIPAQCAPN